jgi:hypothetical protein
MSRSPLISLAVMGTGATHEEANAALTRGCIGHLLSTGMLPADSPLVIGSAPVTAAGPAPLPDDVRAYLEDHHWPADSWRSDLRRWVRQWQPMSRMITRFIVSDFPHTGSWDLMEAELGMTGQLIGGHNSSPKHTLKKLFPNEGRENLIGRNESLRRYEMPQLIAEALREELSEPTATE